MKKNYEKHVEYDVLAFIAAAGIGACVLWFLLNISGTLIPEWIKWLLRGYLIFGALVYWGIIKIQTGKRLYYTVDGTPTVAALYFESDDSGERELSLGGRRAEALLSEILRLAQEEGNVGEDGTFPELTYCYPNDEENIVIRGEAAASLLPQILNLLQQQMEEMRNA